MVESVALCDAVQLSLDPTTAAVNAKVEKVSMNVIFMLALGRIVVLSPGCSFTCMTLSVKHS